jgi:hypothetical protein
MSPITVRGGVRWETLDAVLDVSNFKSLTRSFSFRWVICDKKIVLLHRETAVLDNVKVPFINNSVRYVQYKYR